MFTLPHSRMKDHGQSRVELCFGPLQVTKESIFRNQKGLDCFSLSAMARRPFIYASGHRSPNGHGDLLSAP
jgi:hypothetical protein